MRSSIDIVLTLTIALAGAAMPAAQVAAATQQQIDAGWQALRDHDGAKAATIFDDVLRPPGRRDVRRT
jgi:hypothetical protein